MRKICIINQKGGVGKTTTAINLAAGLSRSNKRVLIIDLDAQANVSSSLNVGEGYKNAYDLLFENAEIKECTINLGRNLDIIKSSSGLSKADYFLAKEAERENFLRERLLKLEGYDYVILDCPPSLNLLNQNAMLFADEAIIPVTTDFLGVDGLRKQAKAIQELNQYFDHNLRISKVVPTMFDKRSKLAHKSIADIQNEFYNVVSDPIRIDTKLRECPLEKKSIFSYAKRSKAAEDYSKLVKHIIRDEIGA
ncbi:ParA family protein [Candidatus Woesearchaeota archaeon]|nr:ParA family protein [Candidatus Woesearchaeota archaeon]